LPQQIAGQDKSNKGDQNEKAREVKKPIVPQMLSPCTGGIAAAVSLVGMMMMFAHGMFKKLIISVGNAWHFYSQRSAYVSKIPYSITKLAVQIGSPLAKM